MELVNGPLSPPAPNSMPAAHGTGAWTEFLHRVLPAAAPTTDTDLATQPAEGADPRPATLSEHDADLSE